MKLYLSSYRVPTPERLFELLNMPPDKTRMAIIINAKDYYEPAERDFKLSALKDDLANIGLRGEFIDLLSFDNPDALETKLKKFDLLFACGGNTFALRYAMKASGFDKIFPRLLQSGIVYAGESAGAVVVGQSLRGFEDMDGLAGVQTVLWEGLGILEVIIAPHSDSPEYGKDMPALRRLYKGHPHFIELKDSEALVVIGEKREITS